MHDDSSGTAEGAEQGSAAGRQELTENEATVTGTQETSFEPKAGDARDADTVTAFLRGSVYGMEEGSRLGVSTFEASLEWSRGSRVGTMNL